jgi:hypothetical protein
MREFLLSLVVCAALVGCDNKPEAGKPAEGGKPAEAGKTAEATKPAAAKHPWGSFKKGSFVKMKSVTDMETPKMKTEMTMTQTLKDLTADEAVIETETVIPNIPPQKSEMKLPLKAAEGKAVDGPKPKTSTEEIEVAGKKLKCTVTEMETEAGGTKTVTKVWTNDEVPGHTVKTQSKNPTMTMTMEVIEFSSK